MRNQNRTPYFDLNGVHVAAIGKNGSSAIGRAIHYYLRPDYIVRSASGNADMVEKVMHNPGWQALAPKTFEPINPIIPVRDPVERFRSACAQEGRTAADAIQRIQDGEISFHFKPVTDYLKVDSRLYKFPEHIAEIAAELGLDEIEEVNTSIVNNGPKPDLTEEELEQVEAIYADDIALYESITEAGQIITLQPPEPEPEPIPVPDSLTRRQFHLAALSMGITKETILSAIDGIEDEAQRAYAKVEYEEASLFKRDWPLLIEMGHRLGLTEEDVDNLFIAAAQE